MITTLTSREFNQNSNRAKQAAKTGPVFITDRGRPAHVLLTIDDYELLKGPKRNLVEMLAMPDGEDIDLDIPPRVVESRPDPFE
jgi:prevent-host-death family protein